MSINEISGHIQKYGVSGNLIGNFTSFTFHTKFRSHLTTVSIEKFP